MMRPAAILGVWLLSLSAAADPVRPRIVSLDYCADQFVLAMADPEQILAVSKDADKPFSHLRESAKGHRQVRAVSEDVIALQPDLVVRSWGGDARAMQFYARLGIQTVQIGYASDIAGAAQITREVADAIGQSERGEILVAGMPPPAESQGLKAVYVTPGGVTAGQGTMVDSLMTHAGLRNAVAASGWQELPLEALVMNPPSLVLSAFFGFDSDATDHWSVARHPALALALAEAEIYPLDESRLTCPAWFVADEAADLRSALDAAP